jgi:hypothetical protein
MLEVVVLSRAQEQRQRRECRELSPRADPRRLFGETDSKCGHKLVIETKTVEGASSHC